jgi:transcriptional regulator with XRE-family HTH domain
MFSPQFHIRLKANRKARRLTQKEAAKLCGLSPGRWSDLECGRRAPDTREVSQIQRHFDLGHVFVPPPKATKQLLDNGTRLTRIVPPFFPQQDRSSYIRYRSCTHRHGDLTRSLTLQLRRQSGAGFPLCELFCHLIRCDSYLESLYVLSSLVDGAIPALVAPARFDPTPLPIVDPETRNYIGNSPQLCLVDKYRHQFFQTSFLGSRVYRVDILEWTGEWRVLELDGEGHSSSCDQAREVAIGLPVTRLHETNVVTKAREQCRLAA